MNTVMTLVLIETSWNVKEEIDGVSYSGAACINRNIVECKGLPLKEDS